MKAEPQPQPIDASRAEPRWQGPATQPGKLPPPASSSSARLQRPEKAPCSWRKAHNPDQADDQTYRGSNKYPSHSTTLNMKREPLEAAATGSRVRFWHRGNPLGDLIGFHVFQLWPSPQRICTGGPLIFQSWPTFLRGCLYRRAAEPANMIS